MTLLTKSLVQVDTTKFVRTEEQSEEPEIVIISIEEGTRLIWYHGG